MPRRSKGPRLYLRRRHHRTASWVILDHGGEIGTGAGESDIGAAEEALARYIGKKHRPDFGAGHPSQVLIADALSEYGEKHAPTTRRPDLIGGAISKLIDFFGARVVAEVTKTTCKEYVKWRVRQTDARAKKGSQADQIGYRSSGASRPWSCASVVLE
jgi:hypothetical protein